jgi:preprotein translocase subunit SecG
MQTIVLVIHVFLAIGVIGLVLIQHGKGADAGAAFGSGASSTVFGSRGSGSFLTRMTTAFALLFFATSMTLFFLASQRTSTIGSVTDNLNLPAIDNSEPAGEQPASESDLPPTPSAGEESESDLPKVDNQ